MTTTLAHLSDIHFGRIDPHAAEALLTWLNDRQPDLVIVSGDLTQLGTVEEFKLAAEWVSRLPGDPLIVPGNHDIPAWNLFLRFFFPLSRFRKYIEPEAYPWREVGNITTVGINTARPHGWYLDWSRGRVGRNQLYHIRDAFEGKESRLRVVVTHHPFLHPPDDQTRSLVKHPGDALSSLADCGVDLLLAGHFHKAYSGLIATRHPRVKSIVVAQSSTSTSVRLKEEPNAFNWIEYEPGKLHIVSQTLSDGAFHPQKEKTYFEVGDDWIPEQEISPEPV